MRPMIRVEGLGKRYRIGTAWRHDSLRDKIADSIAGSFRVLLSNFGKGAKKRSRNGQANGRKSVLSREHIWAVKDLAFEVTSGEIVGVIGRNGAGKSTLLKVLSRITEPTTGKVELRGRVGSLLEVGTGFHPELTGRENVYLNGAILGMNRAEIQRKFDEIVAFAEVEEFIDTPVKRYSSGMYVRLAFAVAAHLETEILLVDEVLAVGDIAFQKKCLGKIGDVARKGRTVLFVSHNMASIESLCTRCIMLRDGRLDATGKPVDIVTRYAASTLCVASGRNSLVQHPGRRPSSVPVMTSVELHSDGAGPTGMPRMGSRLEIRVGVRAPYPIRPVLGISFKTSRGAPVFGVSDRFACQLSDSEPIAEATIACEIEKLPLMPGQYSLTLWMGDPGADLDVIDDAISFEVAPADVLGTGRLPPVSEGPVFCQATWRMSNNVANN
jgi:homopolymeric O-antigen transport system ATP-binding protein